MAGKTFDEPTWTVAMCAEFFNCTRQSVYEMRDKGVLKQLPKLPGVRFNREDVLKVAGWSKDPYEVQKLKEQNRILEDENLMLRQFIAKTCAEGLSKVKKGSGWNHDDEL